MTKAKSAANMSEFDLRLNRRTLQDELAGKLRGAILSGHFKPGERLVESTLCRTLGVSRPSLREALRGLQAQHLVEIVPNYGPQIPTLSWDDAEQIYQVRALLEGEVAALCAEKITAEDVKRLYEALDVFANSVLEDAARSERVSSTEAFYAIIIKASGNRIIQQVLNELLARINFLRARSMSNPGRASQSLIEMRAIFHAIKRGDAVKARAAAQRHVIKAREAAKLAFATLST